MKQIGRGAFTTCYRKNVTTVLLKSNDPVKECMSLGWFPNSNLFPKITRVGDNEYEMRYYHKVVSPKRELKANHYKIYKILRVGRSLGYSVLGWLQLLLQAV